MCASQILKFPSGKFSLEEVEKAAAVVAGHAHRTPVHTSEAINRRCGHQVFFKCENLQKTGSFKIRGALYALSQLAPDALAAGVVTHSSGNHAQALALAARIYRTRAYIVMPRSAPAVKRMAVEEYGGEVHECEPTLAARTEMAEAIRERTGATLIPPFNHPDIIVGQGTCAFEFLQQVPHLDAIMAPVGGGGLISGTCIAARGMSPRIKVFAAEPKGADDAWRSREAGELIPAGQPDTIADGLLTGLGDLTWPFVRDRVHEVLTASDTEIIEAMKFFMERTKLVIEPSAAVTLAVLFRGELGLEPEHRNVGVILCGGNVDLAQLPF